MTFQKHESKRSKPIFTPQDRPWRIAYPFFDEMRTTQANGALMQTPRFDATVCAPKLARLPEHCANFQLLHRLAAEAAALAWPGSPWPIQGGQCKIQDGDIPYVFKVQPGQPPRVYDPVEYAWRGGNWTFEISAGKFRPSVAVMQDGRPMDIPCRVVGGKTYYKGGDYASIRLHTFTYHHESGKFGVKFGFDMILFVNEGEAIGSSGARSAANTFAGLLGTGAPTAPQPSPLPVAAVAPMAPGAPVYAPPSYPAPATAVAYQSPPAGLPPFPVPR